MSRAIFLEAIWVVWRLRLGWMGAERRSPVRGHGARLAAGTACLLGLAVATAAYAYLTGRSSS